jgi:gliding motility-associated-like protein
VTNPTQSTTYYLTGTTGVCIKKDSMLVLVKPAPIADAGQGTTICFGKNASLQAGVGQLSYVWQPTTYLSNINGANADVIQPKNNITYNLSVVGVNGCSSLQDGQVTIQVTPQPKVFVGKDTSIAIGEPFVLQATDVNGSGFNQFAWQPFYLLNDASAQYPFIQNIQNNTQFSVTATTLAGCVGTDTVNIKVFNKADIYVPNAFTPNGDGTNDILRAIPVGIKLFNSFTVYDRYGYTIFNTTSAYNGWDGKNKNGILNTGSFVWVVSGVDFNGNLVERKGTVTLIR